MKPFSPLINAQVHLLHLRAGELGLWTVRLLDEAVRESRAHRAGIAAVLERASEFVFVDAVRHYLDSSDGDAIIALQSMAVASRRSLARTVPSG